MTGKTACAVPYREGHVIVLVYVSADIGMTTYWTAHSIVEQKQSVRETSRTQNTQHIKSSSRSGYSGTYIPFQGCRL